ncbi:unnamed protein product [Darwinula stevensoni]|uniref:PIF1/LRR1 pleckstrin homology domain-containing protein n=1 Tax=Darwinula stevensoni TaxID=69355 RepID=A0A7R9A8B9_9CRUS|nr:unnamed protein product [Darwinula stevensoni]CAG0896264.1 unnamed protein product [Darwinula stevensoni]
MKLKCRVSTSNRLLPSLGKTAGQAPQWGVVTLGIKGKSEPHTAATLDEKKSVFCILICTAANRKGNLYQVENMSGIFARYSQEGKMTLRFKEPPHDICIKDASPEQLRAFLSMLGKAFKRKDVLSLMPHLSPLVPASTAQLQKPVKTLVITSKAQYHALNGFSECLENLKIQVGLKRLDLRITRLLHLSTLDLSGNLLASIPSALAHLPLHTLILAKNTIKAIPAELFYNGVLRKTLCLLDLSGNQMERLPLTLCYLRSLVTLKVSNNQLRHFPGGLARLSQLRYLSVCSNMLDYLPAALLQLRLDYLDVHDNPNIYAVKPMCPRSSQFPTLMELAAGSVHQLRILPVPEDLPRTVYEYMVEELEYCEDGSRRFFHRDRMFDFPETVVEPKNIAATVSASRDLGNFVSLRSRMPYLR